MPGSFSVLFALLIAVPGLLIPLYVCSRMLGVLNDQRRHRAEKLFAGATMIAMLFLMGFSVWAASAASSILAGLADMSR